MPAVLVKAGKLKGGEPILETGGVGHEALHNANGGRAGVLVGLGRRGEAQQRSKLEVHTERRGPRVEWKMEEERRERREDGGGKRKAGWRGQGESVWERGRAGWGLWLPLLTAIDFL